jgi:hypothetical protein
MERSHCATHTRAFKPTYTNLQNLLECVVLKIAYHQNVVDIGRELLKNVSGCWNQVGSTKDMNSLQMVVATLTERDASSCISIVISSELKLMM